MDYITFVDGESEMRIGETLKRYENINLGKISKLCIINTSKKKIKSTIDIKPREFRLIIISDTDRFNIHTNISDYIDKVKFICAQRKVKSVLVILQVNLEYELCQSLEISLNELLERFKVEGRDELKSQISQMHHENLFKKIKGINLDVFWNSKNFGNYPDITNNLQFIGTLKDI